MEFAKGENLSYDIRSGWPVLYLILTIGMTVGSRADDSTAVSSMIVIRSQVQSIADETIDQANFDPKGRIAIIVEGEGPQALVENAFIESLQKRNYISVVKTNTPTEQSINIFLLNSDVKVHELEPKKMERTIRTILKVRIVKGPEHETRILGPFHRETKDTAQVFPDVRLAANSSNGNEGMLRRILTPLMVITGTVLIIYLFFTVRS